jgi:hypothetical protein
MKKIKFYYHLFTSDRKAFWYQLWMVYNRHRINTIKWFYRKASLAKQEFITTHGRPMSATQVKTWSDPLKSIPRTAIVLQGPLLSDHNFTLETIRLYKKHFIDCILIVSTWKGENADTLAKLRAEGIEVLENDKPPVTGVGNVNLQLVSSLAGMEAAKRAGAEFVYKTRCDQRMYGVNINEFLHNLTKAFPVTPGFSQKHRIIASSFLSIKYIPYLITDMFLFGHIDDMIEYWSAKHDTRTALEKPVRTVQDVMDARIAESYLASEYLTRIGRGVTWTIEDSWRAYADHFCIVDRETLDLFWYKYDVFKEYQMKDYGGISNSHLLTFAEWFNLYTGMSNKITIPQTGLHLGRLDYIPAEPVTKN